MLSFPKFVILFTQYPEDGSVASDWSCWKKWVGGHTPHHPHVGGMLDSSNGQRACHLWRVCLQQDRRGDVVPLRGKDRRAVQCPCDGCWGDTAAMDTEEVNHRGAFVDSLTVWLHQETA